jgi:hypothetical protein
LVTSEVEVEDLLVARNLLQVSFALAQAFGTQAQQAGLFVCDIMRLIDGVTRSIEEL